MEMSWNTFGPCPFSVKELDGQSVEYEGPDYSTIFGTLWAQQKDQDQVRLEIRVLSAGTPPAPVTDDTKFLRLHPKPKRRAKFLWAKHPARLLATMTD